MANYISSESIKIFPSAYRENDSTSSLTTEANLTGLAVSCADKDSFAKFDGDNVILCIGGYTFRTTFQALVGTVGQEATDIWASIRVDSTDPEFPALANYDDGGITLDEDSVFKGLHISDSEPDSGYTQKLHVLQKELGAWVIPTEGRAFIKTSSVSNVITEGSGAEAHDVEYSINDKFVTAEASVGDLSADDADIGTIGANQIHAFNPSNGLIVNGMTTINNNGNVSVDTNGSISFQNSGLSITKDGANVTSTFSSDAVFAKDITFGNNAKFKGTLKADSGAHIESDVIGTLSGLNDSSTSIPKSDRVLLSDTNQGNNHNIKWSDHAFGNAQTPVFINSSGVLTTCSTYAGGTKVTLNGNDDRGANTASFYAPTSNGDDGQVVVSKGVNKALGYTSSPTLASLTVNQNTEIKGNAEIGGTLEVTGNTTLKGTLGVTGNISGNVTGNVNGVLTGVVSDLDGQECHMNYNNQILLSLVDIDPNHQNTAGLPYRIKWSDHAFGSATTPIYIDKYGRLQEGTQYAGGTNLAINGVSQSGQSVEICAPVGYGLKRQVVVSQGPGQPLKYTYELSVTSVEASTFSATSDRRLKDNIEGYEPSKSILDLPLRQFDMKSDRSHHIGCIAQELQEIAPELVHEGADGYLSIEESKLVYLLIDEVRKLKEEVKSLKGE